MYDIIIIGAGTAGIAAYNEAIKYTQNILIINDGPWDTTCARVGCMPSKVLIASANRMHDVKHANDLALSIEFKVDTSKVMIRVRELRDHFTRATLKDVNSWPEEHKLSGHAKFINANTVEVNGHQYQSKSFVLAVGSYPTLDPKLKQQLGRQLISSDEIFEIPQLPKAIAVIGSGVIAIELAQAMQRLGVKTTIFARSQKVGVLTSPELQTIAQSKLSQELEFKFKVLPNHYEKINNAVKVHFKEQEQAQSIEVDYVLSATGRTSYLDTLALENIDLQFKDLKNLPLNHQSKQLANLPIFIVGDAAMKNPIQHEAAYAGKSVIQNCLNFPNIQNIPKLPQLGIVFSQPEMAIVGESFKSLQDQHIPFITGHVSYEKQGRALVQAENHGAVEIYIDPQSRQILGAELFCPQAEHLAHLLAWMIGEKLTIDEVLSKPYYHPTLEEGLRTALKHARRQLLPHQ
ncbi:dihydrolipoyl dehydrogenase [Acinetobacter sp. BSP-28]|uniref:dihydrolipoyl dehydrogenase n=1 Tax=Acinetobacter sp. BSP-28 TaxID=3344661 RepID=UPI00377042AE